jgi:hypothetical protein
MILNNIKYTNILVFPPDFYWPEYNFLNIKGKILSYSNLRDFKQPFLLQELYMSFLLDYWSPS